MRIVDQDTGEPFDLIPTDELFADLRVYHDGACSHEKVRLTRSVIKGGGIQYRHQCLHCGELQGGPLKHSAVAPNVPAKDETLEPRYDRTRRDELDDIYQKHIRKQKARDNAWWDRYHQHMKSPEWAAMRVKVLRWLWALLFVGDVRFGSLADIRAAKPGRLLRPS
jgi:hypothetical protein